MSRLHADDRRLSEIADADAAAGYEEGACPIGAVLSRGGRAGGTPHVQAGDPIAHGEMDPLRKSARQRRCRGKVFYTTLLLSMVCAGTIIPFAVPHAVIGKSRDFGGNEGFPLRHGVVNADDPAGVALMAGVITEKPALWNEDIAAA